MLRSFFAAVAVLATTAYAQTETNCNPLNVTTCPLDTALGIKNYTWDATSDREVDLTLWNSTGSTMPGWNADGMTFTIKKKGDSPTLVSTFYYFFGVVSVVMKASPGTGIISAVTSLSDDLDEIDWEFKGGNGTAGYTNFYGKPYPGMLGSGTDEGLPFDPRADFHNYTTVWTNDTLQWLIDGKVYRTVKNGDPSTEGGLRYPQTPMTVKIGTWAGGSSDLKGVVDWAGGATDYGQGPFDMVVKSVYVSDFSTGSQYKYTDTSGMANSIQALPGNSTAANYILNKATGGGTSISQKFNNLSPGVKTGIAIAAVSVAALGALIMAVCCIKQRRAGRKERAVADAEFQKQEAELMAYRMAQKGRHGQMPGFGYNDFKGKR